MKTALLHYWLTNVRGGEKVLSALGDMFPAADIFTHAYVPKRFGETSGRRLWGHNVIESFISRLPAGRIHPQIYLPILPMATRKLRLDGYDLIVSSESGPIKGINKPSGAFHICYCHTPMRYLWDMHDEYYRTAGICGKLSMRIFTKYLRREDLRSAEAVDQFVANSRFVSDRIKRIYGRSSVVVYPPVNVGFYDMRCPAPTPPPYADRPYYLYAGELCAYKRPDIAIAACRRMGRRLVVIGNGVMGKELMRMAAGDGDIVFLGRVSDEELRAALICAKALLFPGVEDFGIVPVEAQAAGTPVVAFGAGGALETVVKDVTGVFFYEATVDALCAAIEVFESRTWSPERCNDNAMRFSRSRFIDAFRDCCRNVGK